MISPTTNGSVRVLVASDSFKGSASSREVNELVSEGIRRVLPDVSIQSFPIADGGEGTVEAIVTARRGELRRVDVTGPLGEPEHACYGIVDGDTAVIEMAEASGITLIDQNAANALRASTFGVGQVILDALDAGVRRICIGLGGSATSDGGAGMAKALGARLLDASGSDTPCGLAGLEELASIDVSGMDPRIKDVEVVALTDVSNPLCGTTGAISVYGPQKGIDGNEIDQLDGWMHHYGELLASDLGSDAADVPGAGAAGGLGAGLIAFCGARVEPGIEFVLDAIRIDEALTSTDLVVTGEGRMDAQSAFGKAPVGVARRARAHGVPVAAVVGSRALDLGGVYDEGIGLVIPTCPGPMSLKECISQVGELLPVAGETVARAWLLGTQATDSVMPSASQRDVAAVVPFPNDSVRELADVSR